MKSRYVHWTMSQLKDSKKFLYKCPHGHILAEGKYFLEVTWPADQKMYTLGVWYDIRECTLCNVTRVEARLIRSILPKGLPEVVLMDDLNVPPVFIPILFEYEHEMEYFLNVFGDFETLFRSKNVTLKETKKLLARDCT